MQHMRKFCQIIHIFIRDTIHLIFIISLIKKSLSGKVIEYIFTLHLLPFIGFLRKIFHLTMERLNNSILLFASAFYM